MDNEKPELVIRILLSRQAMVNEILNGRTCKSCHVFIYRQSDSVEVIFKGVNDMECPYCGSELEYEDYFGRIAAHQDGKIFGDIYRCPNGRNNNDECESSMFHVSGSFYAYRDDPDHLLDGYPC